MDNRVAGCQPPAGATPLLRFGLPSPPGVVGMVMAPGSASGKHPFYLVCKCGLGCCVCGGRRVGVGVWGLGLLVVLHVCALFVGGGGWVWVKCPCGGFGSHPGCWVFGWCWCSRRVVWLSATVVVVYSSVVVCCCVLLCAGEFHCVPLPALACSAALCAMLPPRCALRCLHEARRPRLPGQGRSSRGGRVWVTSEALGQGCPPIGGAESEPPGPACDSCARAPFVGGGGYAWVQCPCGGSAPLTGRWVLGWRWCLRRVVWLSAAIIVVHCFALFCCTVCCVLSCAGKFRYVSLPALRCCAALCAVLPP